MSSSDRPTLTVGMRVRVWPDWSDEPLLGKIFRVDDDGKSVVSVAVAYDDSPDRDIKDAWDLYTPDEVEVEVVATTAPVLRRRAYTLVSVGTLPIGTLGWISPTVESEHVDMMEIHANPDTEYVSLVFEADNGQRSICYASDVETVPDDFNPRRELEAATIRLAKTRQELDRRETAYDERKREIERELVPLKQSRDAVRDEESVCYNAVAILARVVHAATGDKQPDPDIQMKSEKTVVYDSFEAVKWAIAHDRTDLLRLDDKAFDKNARAGKLPEDAPFKLHEQWKPYVASSLDHRLPEDEPKS